MKKGMLVLLLFCSAIVNAQSLKDALFGGKLKNAPGTVIRKGDDLSTRIDSVRKAPVEETAKAPASPGDTLAQKASSPDIVPSALNPEKATGVVAAADSTENLLPAKSSVASPKDNNAIWKSFMDSLSATLKTEVLSSRKVKNGSYYVLVSYAIATDGQVTINDVFVSPENAFLQQQIKDRLALEAPRLTPARSESGAPRKVNKKYNFTLIKE